MPMTTARRWRIAASITSITSVSAAAGIVLSLSEGHHAVAAALVPVCVILAWASTAANHDATLARWTEETREWQQQYNSDVEEESR